MIVSLYDYMIIVNTVRGLMVCKINFCLTCNEFYEKNKNNIAVLKKIHSTETEKVSLLPYCPYY